MVPKGPFKSFHTPVIYRIIPFVKRININSLYFHFGPINFIRSAKYIGDPLIPKSRNGTAPNAENFQKFILMTNM